MKKTNNALSGLASYIFCFAFVAQTAIWSARAVINSETIDYLMAVAMAGAAGYYWWMVQESKRVVIGGESENV